MKDGHVQERNFVRNLKGRGHLEVVGIDRRATLKCTLKKQGAVLWTILITKSQVP